MSSGIVLPSQKARVILPGKRVAPVRTCNAMVKSLLFKTAPIANLIGPGEFEQPG